MSTTVIPALVTDADVSNLVWSMKADKLEAAAELFDRIAVELLQERALGDIERLHAGRLAQRLAERFKATL